MRPLLLLLLAFSALPLPSFSQTEDAPENYEQVWIVVADTGQHYAKLHRKMEKLSRKSNLKVDLLDRSWNEEKQRITLPPDSDDDIWAGEYYPRRTGDPYLSLEQLDWYTDQSTEQTIALFAGFSTEKQEAEKLLGRVQRFAPQAHLLSHNLYVGCMH